MAPHAYDVAEIPPPRSHKPKRSNRILGDYTLSKTLGAGSMGKVKLATHNVTGEEFAIKILPRARAASSQSPSKDAGKEIRTLREAGLSLLLHHPYICGMREMIVHPNHYYMVFEHVSGGQLLDFIIAHGRLRESVARRFARQITSALDYCHRNNVVHRDLKIENILISQTGNIKIIDFGLSNLYDPASHLGTFCGSLYFAAPELLNAKLYTGPEVDIWSFGVVLYTLVCGKVPFENESMPVLHAMIKRGMVEYPVWLSPECKNLLSRMLVVNPSRRAQLSEIASHPWILRGSTGPPATHLPARVPLRTADLDPAVIARMAGFDFGEDVEEVMEKLHAVLESDVYMHAVLAWEHQRSGHGPLPPELSLASLGSSSHSSSVPASPVDPSTPTSKQRRRFSGFDLYRRVFASTPPPPSPEAPPPPPPRDPTNGFHPLISMYFLAREKLERERLYGTNVFASSQVSLGGPAEKVLESAGVNGNGTVAVEEEEDATAPEIGHEHAQRNGHEHRREQDWDQPQSAEQQPMEEVTPVARPPTPGPFLPETKRKAVAVRAANGVPTPVNGAPKAESRAPIEDVFSDVAPFIAVHAEPEPIQIIEPPTLFSPTQVRDAPAEETPAPAPAPQSIPASEKAVVVQEPEPQHKSEVHKDEEGRSPRRRERSQTLGGGTSLLRRFGSIFLGAGRHDGTDTVRQRTSSKRKSMLADGGAVHLPPKEEERTEVHAEKKEKGRDTGKKEEAPVEAVSPAPPPAPVSSPASALSPVLVVHESAPSAPAPLPTTSAAPALLRSSPATPSPPVVTTTSSPPSSSTSPKDDRGFGSIRRRAATLLDPATRAARHERRSSTGGAILTSAATVGHGRTRRTSVTGYESATMTKADRTLPQTVPEMGERSEELSDNEGARDGHADAENEGYASEKEPKPVFMKGLFSVSTTSTKPAPIIKADIRRVLDRMQVRYWQNKTGFECVHLPSINAASPSGPSTDLNGQHSFPSSGDTSVVGAPVPGAHGTIGRRVSRLSFSVRRVKSQDRDFAKSRDPKTLGRPLSTIMVPPPNSAHQPLVVPDTPPSDAAQPPVAAPASSLSVNSKVRSIHSDIATVDAPLSPVFDPHSSGEMDRETFETMAHNALSVRFEIKIVKVPLLPLHGIQFRRAGGDGWQYQTLARRVLTELKL